MIDVFVSYARYDDLSARSTDKGWVSLLVDALHVELAPRLGRSPMIFQDTGLAKDQPLTTEIRAKLDESSVLLVILSESYLRSRWCRRERKWFLGRVGAPDGRVHVVHRTPIDLPRRPKPLRDLLGVEFCEVDRNGRASLFGPPDRMTAPRSYARLEELAEAVANGLKRLAGAPLPRRSGPRSAVRHAEQPDARNALELRSKNTSTIGSGYVIATGLAITAMRAIHHHARKVCDVICRPIRGDWRPASMVARGGDAAVLKADVKNGSAAVPWARWRRFEPIACKFIGFRPPPFPAADMDTFQGIGALVPENYLRSRKIALRPIGEFTEIARDTRSVRGFAGAAVFAKGHLLGVISHTPETGSMFIIEPIDRLATTLKRRKTDSLRRDLPDMSKLPYVEDIPVLTLPDAIDDASLRALLDDQLAGIPAAITDNGDE